MTETGVRRRRPPIALLVESGVVMIAASLAIRLIPLRRLTAVLGMGAGDGKEDKEQVDAVLRAIRAWSRRLPWRTMCFEEGLSAHLMLRRRGLASTLYYGAATIEGELKAHVWVRSGDMDVTGCETADKYAILARFPAT